MRTVTLITLLCGAAACSISDTLLAGKACDSSHACPTGLSCVSGICESELDAGDSGVFNAKSTWRAPVAASPARSTDEAAILSAVQSVKPAANGLQLNQTVYTPIVVFATADTTRGDVTDQVAGGWRMEGVPLPNAGEVNNDPQGIMVIVDADRNRVWNFAGAKISSPHILAPAFAVFELDGPGWWDASTSTGSGRACDASYLGGLIFAEELQAGHIDHAISLSVDSSVISDATVAPVLPASSGTGHATGVPLGTLLQLDPAYDVSHFGAEGQIVARAWQKYGAYVVDAGGGVAIFFRSTFNLAANPYDGMDFSGLTGELLRHQRVIAPAPSYAYDRAESFSPAEPHR
jgi:hypothetical protein